MPHRLLFRILRLIVVASAMCMAACSYEILGPADPGESAPDLPSVSTMGMNLSLFGIDEDLSLADVEEMLTNAGSKGNWIQAVIRVVFLRLSFYDFIEETGAAFAAAGHAVPQSQPDGSHLWTYIYVKDGTDYSIFLFSKVVGARIEWRMEVSSSDAGFPLDHFVWFEGESMLDGSGGYWHFYRLEGLTAEADAAAAITPGDPAVRIDWQHRGRRFRRITIRFNLEGHQNEGDVLDYRRTPDKDTLDQLDGDSGENHNITAYRDGSGSLTVPDYNGGEPACWDTEQEDTDCP